MSTDKVDFERCYLRFGDLPDDGLSMNGTTTSTEPGLSVFAGRRRCRDGHDEFVMELPNRQLSHECALLFDKNRPLYVVSGRELTDRIGCSGEPLLTEASVVEEVRPGTRIRTDPAIGIRYRDRQAKEWSERRRAGRLGMRDQLAMALELVRMRDEGLEDLGEALEKGVGLNGSNGFIAPEGWPELSTLRPKTGLKTVMPKALLGVGAGCWLVEDRAAYAYALKVDYDPKRIREQEAAAACYRALGVPVPASAVYYPADPRDGSGDGPARRLSVFVEGSSLIKLENYVGRAMRDTVALLKEDGLPGESDSKAKTLKEAAREHFAADALFGNWDVVGQAKDRLLLGADGAAWRLGMDGALRYRARGTMKLFGPDVAEELAARRDPEHPWYEVFGVLADEVVAGQIERIVLPNAGPLLAAAPEDLKETMTARVRSMGEWAEAVRAS